MSELAAVLVEYDRGLLVPLESIPAPAPVQPFVFAAGAGLPRAVCGANADVIIPDGATQFDWKLELNGHRSLRVRRQ